MEVERSGVAVIYRHEIRAELAANRRLGTSKIVTREQVGRLAEEHHLRGEKIVFTNGCFDLLRVGHVTYLAEAAALGNMLIVGVNSDASVRKLKGPSRPVISETDRAAMLAALACVQYVVVFDDDTPLGLLEAIRPDVLVKGGTYTPDQVVGHEFVTSYGGSVSARGGHGRRDLDHEDSGLAEQRRYGSLHGSCRSAWVRTAPNPQPRLRRAG